MTTNPDEQTLRDLAARCIGETLKTGECLTKLVVGSDNIPKSYCGINFPDYPTRCCCMQGKEISTSEGPKLTCYLPADIEDLKAYLVKGHTVEEVNELILERLLNITQKNLNPND